MNFHFFVRNHILFTTRTSLLNSIVLDEFPFSLYLVRILYIFTTLLYLNAKIMRYQVSDQVGQKLCFSMSREKMPLKFRKKFCLSNKINQEMYLKIKII